MEIGFDITGTTFCRKYQWVLPRHLSVVYRSRFFRQIQFRTVRVKGFGIRVRVEVEVEVRIRVEIRVGVSVGVEARVRVTVMVMASGYG